jgi:OPA family glycerol-3-phosphate transporter-like MFS transporter
VDKLTQEVVPIIILIVAIALVVGRLPKVDVGHTAEFRRRRVLNWLPLGLTYAFLYMGRYNLNTLKDWNIITGEEFGVVDGIGSITYGLAFLLNGPLTDRWGGRATILIAAAGSAVCNAVIGISIASSANFWSFEHGQPPTQHWLIFLFAANMYFQSFGAVSIVKVNASWFHLRERGTFGGIFGILISLGLYLAFDWAPKITQLVHWLPALFIGPAILITVFLVLSYLFVRDTPADAGLVDFDVADASSGDTGPADKALVVIKKLLTSRIILTIAFISLCSGFLRQGILKWYRTFASGVHVQGFIVDHWGMVSCVAGITGGMFAGVISDHLFKSRRPPVATLLFSFLLVGAVAIIPALSAPATVSFVIAFMAMSVIGVHGMLSGVASQDFGGRRNAGTATGLIDGFVYFGTAFQGFVYGFLLPESKIFVPTKIPVFELSVMVTKTNPESKDISNWYAWPIAMIPIAVVGLALSLSILKAIVGPRKSGS